MLNELVSRMEAAVETFTDDYEIILVNDCSPDDSWAKMKEIWIVSYFCNSIVVTAFENDEAAMSHILNTLGDTSVLESMGYTSIIDAIQKLTAEVV